MEGKKSYYAIIPANVRYDKNLNANAKLLYGEITALCNEKGYCWATNEYFASLYNTSEKTITRWISSLKDSDYIDTKIETFRYEDGTVKKIRYIFLDKIVINQQDKFSNNQTDINVLNHTDKIVLNHTDNNVPYNNTINNITRNNNTINNIYSPAKAEPNIPYKEIIDYLNMRTGSNYKHTTNKTKDLIKARFNEGFTIDDFKTVIDKKCMEWINDKTMNKFLRPETLFGNKFEGYLNQQMKQKLTTKDIPIDISDF